MRGSRVKKLRREAEAGGIKLTKKGWRRLKDASRKYPNLDGLTIVKELRRRDILKAVKSMTPEQKQEFIRRYADEAKKLKMKGPVDTGRLR